MQMLNVCVLCASCGSLVDLRHQPGVEWITSVSDECTLTCSYLNMNIRTVLIFSNWLWSF